MHRNRIGLKVAVDLQVENLWINLKIVQPCAGYAAHKKSLRAAGRRRVEGFHITGVFKSSQLQSF